MNVITTSHNDTDYTAATKFVCRSSGSVVTIPANTPVDVRSMHDSCRAGSYSADPTTITGGDDQTNVTATTATISATCSWNGDGTNCAGVTITATSSDTAVATVADASCDGSGVATVTVTKVTTGTATITLTGPGTSATDEVEITFA